MAYSFGAPSIVQDGLVLYYDSANPNSCTSTSAGDKIFDLSDITYTTGSNPNNTGSFEGTVTKTAGNLAFDFNATGDNISIPNFMDPLSDNSKFPNGNNNPNITLSCWVNNTNLNSGDNSLMWIGDTTARGVHAMCTNSTRYSFLHYGDDAIFTDYTVPAATWQHVTMTYNTTGRVNQLYVDGNLIQTISNVPTVDINIVFPDLNLVGNYRNSKLGFAACFMIYNRVITASEVFQNYNALKGRFV